MRRLSTFPSSLLISLVTLDFVPQADGFPRLHFQSTAILQGRVLDQNGAVVARARISAQNTATGLGRLGQTEGNYQIAALPVGNYRVEVKAACFRTEIVEHVSIEAGRVVGSATSGIGQISNTRFPTGDSGSSRQMQFALKFMF
jgi:Carboxypeptidase regulatory-like domain